MKPNSIGVHNLVFVTDWSEASARQAITTAAEIGFDHIEVVIFDPLTTATALTTRLAREAGIDVAAGMALNPAADISSPDPEIAAHLGEVLWAQGQRDEAGKLWQASLQTHPGNEVLLETLRRLSR